MSLQAEDDTIERTVNQTVGDWLQGAEEPMETSIPSLSSFKMCISSDG